jgi:hypothetical protein
MNRPDVCDLVTKVYAKDNEGYETETEVVKQVFCNWSEGVSQNEYYLSHKEGFEASASVEIVSFDYDKQKIVDFHGVRYNVIRAFQRRPDYVTLILEEVVR